MATMNMASQLPSRFEEDPGLPFPARTGRGARVAVIDSGVNSRHPHISGVAGGVSIGDNGEIEVDSYSDVLGHGTAVMAAIQEKAPDAQYFAVQLFRASLRTTTERLIRALEWAVEQRMDVVNLSLGTRNQDYKARFEEVIAHAVQNGVLLVAAREADGQPCFPGSLPGVFSVGLDSGCPRNRYRCEQAAGGLVFYSSGYPRSLPGVPRERNLQGISFAVANMTGFIARACEGIPAEHGPRRPAIVRDALLAEAANRTTAP
jgi:subtilisin family serine protease